MRCFNSYGVVFAKQALVDASYFWQYYASRMRGRILQIVGLVLLAVTVASVVSPWFDLDSATLRTSKRTGTHVGLATSYLLSAFPISPTLRTMPPTLPSHQTHDIVARDCARLC